MNLISLPNPSRYYILLSALSPSLELEIAFIFTEQVTEGIDVSLHREAMTLYPTTNPRSMGRLN